MGTPISSLYSRRERNDFEAEIRSDDDLDGQHWYRSFVHRMFVIAVRRRKTVAVASLYHHCLSNPYFHGLLYCAIHPVSSNGR